jgi:hypothetical protein
MLAGDVGFSRRVSVVAREKNSSYFHGDDDWLNKQFKMTYVVECSELSTIIPYGNMPV